MDTQLPTPTAEEPAQIPGDLPDTSGFGAPPPDPGPTMALPDTSGADQNLPQPTQPAPTSDPIPARPGDPDQTPITPKPAGSAWHKGAMIPRDVYGLFLSEVQKQGLVGVVPSDGAKYGIHTGSASEWAKFFTGLAAHESGLKNETVGDAAQFRGGSRGLLQLSYDDAQPYGLNGGKPFTPEQLADPAQNAAAGVAIVKQLVGKAGSIQGGAGKYWGPISKEGWTPGHGRDWDLPWKELDGDAPTDFTAPITYADAAPPFAPSAG